MSIPIPTDWGTHRAQRYTFGHISQVLYSIIPIFNDFVNQFVPNDFISLLKIPMYWGPGGPQSKAPNYAYAVLIDGTIY